MGVDTAHIDPATAVGAPRASATAVPAGRREPALLEPAPGGPAERFAAAVGYGHPVRVFLAAAVGGYVLLVAFMTALGFLLTKVLLEMGGFAAWDEHISKWLADHRTPLLVDLSWVGSTV